MPEKEQKINKETFAHLVDLAALELGDEESAYILQEMNKQLAAIDELASIKIPADTPPASHGVPYTDEISQSLRSDDSEQCEDANAILSQTPDIKERFIIVPEIPHTSLE